MFKKSEVRLIGRGGGNATSEGVSGKHLGQIPGPQAKPKFFLRARTSTRDYTGSGEEDQATPGRGKYFGGSAAE